MNSTVFRLPKLQYKLSDLEPYISSNTMDFHYNKHHQAYVTNLNDLLAKRGWFADNLESIIMQTYNKDDDIAIFNNAGQVWNHNFYWQSIKLNGHIKQGEILKQIEKDFGGMEKLKELFVTTGLSQFGSGWVWLVWESKLSKLKVIRTQNAEMPMIFHQKAILVADVWEHAYYLDYQNRRKDYLEKFFDNLINWQFAEDNFNMVK